MSKTRFILTLLLIFGLGGLCLYLNRDWFTRRTIQISHRVSPWLRAPQGRRAALTGDANPVVFSFDRFYRFKEIKVVLAAEIATNKYAHPLWHLVTSSNSAPISSFAYGERLRGMRPERQGAVTDPLEPGVQYRLWIRTEDDEAHHDFSTTARP